MTTATAFKVRFRQITLVRETPIEYNGTGVITSPHRLAQYIREYCKQLDDVEHFFVIPLSTANKPLGVHVISKGTLGACLIQPREVFRAAIALNAASVIIAHTHPSGNPEPSRDDLAITKALTAAGRILEIHVLDHVIVPLSAEGCTSLAERHEMG